MKKSIAIVLSLVLMFAFTAVTFAAEKEMAPAKKEMKAEKKEMKAEKKAAKKQVTGEVTAVDATANTLTVKGKKGDVTVSTDDKTTVMEGKAKKTLADIKAGDKVTVHYTVADGKEVATKVVIKAAPAKKSEKKAEKKAKAVPAEKEAPAAAPAKKAAGY